jgi:hypothetical protein
MYRPAESSASAADGAPAMGAQDGIGATPLARAAPHRPERALRPPAPGTTASSGAQADASTPRGRRRFAGAAWPAVDAASGRVVKRRDAASTLGVLPAPASPGCHRMPPGPRLTSGGARPNCAATSAGDGSGAAASSGLLPPGQGRTNSPPGPNWQYGTSPLMLPPAFLPAAEPVSDSVRITGYPNIGQTSSDS